MAIMMSFRMKNNLTEQRDVPNGIHVPMVYEQVAVEPAHWEYRVLTVDAREGDLADVDLPNELGSQGWLLVGVLDQGATGRSPKVHYYFVRQKSE